ncbi:MAG: DUF4430 domain-containing protein [Candidatus Buchananbacteria bacterium]
MNCPRFIKLLFFFLVFGSWAIFVLPASAVGVMVRPSQLDFSVPVFKTETKELLVINSGVEPAIFQLRLETKKSHLAIEPSEFKLDANESRIVKVKTFFYWPGEYLTIVDVVARPLAAGGLSAASGLKIPVKVAVSGQWLFYLASTLILVCLIIFLGVKLSKRSKNEIISWLARIIIVAAIIVGVALVIREQTRDSSEEISIPVVNPVKTQAMSSDEKKLPAVSLIIDFGSGQKKSFSVPAISEKTTVFNLLQAVLSKNKIDLGFKDYGGDMGVMIESIDSIKNNGQAGRYWQYWVNGRYASLGASSNYIKAGDLVEWKYVKQQSIIN